MKVLVAAFGKMGAAKLQAQTIDHWLTEHIDWSPATKNRYRACLSLVYRQGMRNARVTVNPARLVAARKESSGRVRYRLDREEQALRAVLNGYQARPLAELDIALHVGMRRSEQYTFTWD